MTTKFKPAPPQMSSIALFGLNHGATLQQLQRKTKMPNRAEYSYTIYEFMFPLDLRFNALIHEHANTTKRVNQELSITCVDGHLRFILRDNHTTYGVSFDLYKCTTNVKDDGTLDVRHRNTIINLIAVKS